MPTCFMIQPFDQAKFDRRYKDIFKPAIVNAGFEADRVDEDPSVTVVIDRIEKGIMAASVCLAEITTDNANVWFELGYALACKKPVVIICEKHARTKFPFDVQHRNILQYGADSSSDFEELKTKIVERLKAIDKTQGVVKQLPSEGATADPRKFMGLSRYEVIVLTAVVECSTGGSFFINESIVLRACREKTLHQSQAVLGLRQLINKELLILSVKNDISYAMTDSGWALFEKIADNLPLQPPPMS